MDSIVRQVPLILSMVLSLVQCEPPLNNQYGVPGNFGNNRGVHGGGHDGFGGGHSYDNGNNIDQDYVDNQPKSYEFGYAVKDVATGNDFGRRETSDGETVRGEYRVQLPDGRTQIVSYTADWRTGFHADVRYEGTATYPDQYNTQANGYNAGNAGGPGGIDYQGGGPTGGGPGYQGAGNNGGFNNYRPGTGGGNYNNGNGYQYPFGSNSIDNSYNFGGTSRPPSPTYGPSFH